MAEKLPPLRYVLPKTVFAITLARRTDVVIKPEECGSFPQDSIDVKLKPKVVADGSRRCITHIDEELLEKISISVSLSEEGVIESVGAETGRDPTPIIGLAAKVLVVGAQFLAARWEPDRQPQPFEEMWAQQHTGLADTLAALERRIEHYLGVVAADGSSAADVVVSGEALRVLERQAAAVDRLRREWIAQHAKVGDAVSVELDVQDLVAPKENVEQLPQRMVRADFNTPASWADFAKRYGAFVAIADPVRNWDKPQTPALETTDTLIMRRPRPVQVGIYKRSRGETNDDEVWELQDGAVTLDVIDAYSYYDVISLDGKWWRERTVELSMYPDQSIKTWAVTSSSMAGAVATSVGTVVDAVGAVQKARSARPSAGERELEQAKLKLDLLKVGTETAQLYATHERAAELAELEQRVKLSELDEKV